MARHYKRRRILIDPLQHRLLAITLLYFLATTAIFALALFFPLILELRDSAPDVQQRAITATEFLALHRRFWPALMLTFFFLALHSVFTTHRIAGPLYRFRAVFKSIAEGNLNPWTGIRSRDLLAKEAEALQEMVGSLQERIGRIVDDFNEARRGVNLVKRAVVGRSIDDARAQIAQLEARMVALGESVGEFTYEDESSEQNTTAAEGTVDELAYETGGEEAFTTVELAIVVTLIGLIAAIGLPAYMEALDEARVARAIGDIAAMSEEISLFWFDNGRYPNNLLEINRGGLLDPYGNPYQYLNIGDQATGKGKGGVGQARKDRFLVPVNSDFDLYSMGKDGDSVPPFTAQASHDDIVRANNGAFIGLAEEF